MLSRNSNSGLESTGSELTSSRTRIERMMSPGWLGQTLASLCWILSVFVYGISHTGDWLQLLAASSWMISNLASIYSIE